MQLTPEHPNENARQRELDALGILDTDPEERFDRITRLASELFDVPVVLVSLVDRERQWFKSRVGLSLTETERCVSFCTHAILEHMLVIEDALTDDRFADNPLVTAEPGIRFYAGVGVKGPAGLPVGTLCLIDYKPRIFSGAARTKLRDLGKIVEAELAHPRPAEDARESVGKTRTLTGKTPWSRLHNRAWALSVTLIVGLILLALVQQWDYARERSHHASVEKQVLGELTLLRGKLESIVNSRLHLAHGLSGYLRAGGATDEKNFSTFAEQLAGDLKGIRSLQLAPDGVVAYVWPLETNRQAIGHDLLADPGRRRAARRAIDEKQMWIAGPFELLQGGTALVARRPIFEEVAEGREQFWGFATVLVDYDAMIEEAGLDLVARDLDIGIRGKDGLGMDGEVFYGVPDIFERASITQSITLPAGTWIIAGTPPGGFRDGYPGRALFIGAAAISSAGILMLLYYLVRLPARQQQAIAAAVEEIERNERFINDAIEALPSGFVVYDRQGGLVMCNEKFREMHPGSRASLRTGQTLEQIMHAALEAGDYRPIDNEADTEARLCAAIRDRHGTPVELELGDGRWVRAVERSMRDGGTVGFRVDITELKQSESELAQAKERAENANQAKSDFLASVSHEVRTPLNGVLGLLGVLKEDKKLAEEHRRYAETAHLSASHLLTILNEILDISKIEAGKLELEQLPFNPLEITRESLDMIATDADRKNLALRLDADPSTDVTVLGDSGRLRQVLLNLLSNAIKFTDHGEITVALRHRGESGNRISMQIDVVDTGPGFDPGRVDELFERFTQADSSVVRRHSGTGLGLPISRHLVEMMGGTINAYARPGQGATFTICLDFERLQRDLSSKTEPLANVPTPNSAGLPPVRVLAAEDSPTNQLVLAAMLEGTGYILDTVADGEEAVEALGRLRYDIVLMDIQMPVLDGVEAARLIRQRYPQFATVPIIALTANAMKGDRERYISAGMCDYLPKPLAKENLLQRLWRWSQAPAGQPQGEQTETAERGQPDPFSSNAAGVDDRNARPPGRRAVNQDE